MGILTAGLGGWLLAGSALAQVELSSAVDKAQAQAGEEITFSITLKSGEDFRDLQVPEAGGRISDFDIVDFGFSEPEVKDDGLIHRRRWYRLRADVSGSYVLPAVELNYTAGEHSQTVTTSEIFVEITKGATGQSEEAEEGGGLRDIKPLRHAPADWTWLAVVAGGLTVFAIALFGIFRWQRAARKDQPPIPPHELAATELKRLKGGGLLQAGKVKEFHFQLSHILRAYVEGRFELPATDRTLEEIRRDIDQVAQLAEVHRQTILRLLKEGDLVKYADTVLDDGVNMQMLDQAYDFVDATKPTPLPDEQVDGQVSAQESVI